MNDKYVLMLNYELRVLSCPLSLPKIGCFLDLANSIIIA